MSQGVERKIALVTGAGRGIGKAIALSLAEHGHYVSYVSVGIHESCSSTASEIQENGGDAESLAIDVSDSKSVESACSSLLEKHENIDILVNNAGITKDNLIFRMSEGDWDDVINTNLKGCFSFIKYLARPMTRKRWGRIINIASVIGLTGNAGQVNYAFLLKLEL